MVVLCAVSFLSIVGVAPAGAAEINLSAGSKTAWFRKKRLQRALV